MDLRNAQRGAPSAARTLRATLTLVLLGTVVLGGTASYAETSLWLVRPLYPGQEALVARTEAALDRLMVGEARKDAIIGTKELGQSLKLRKLDELPCFTAERRCADPIDPFFAGLGFDRVVLIQGGQDEAGFKFRVAAYEPKSGKVMPAAATNANLEKALLGAVAKVVPAASSLEVKSTPSGATVYVDDVKVGVTPLSTQVLPGERVIRLDLKLHQPVEESLVIPIRGSASLERTLEKVAARIIITASPAGAEISLDGQVIGKDKVDRGISPGTHTVRLTAENYKSFEQQVTVKADDTFSLDKSLEAIPGQSTTVIVVGSDPAKPPKEALKDDPYAIKLVAPPPTPPTPASPADLIYDRRSWISGSFEFGRLVDNTLVGRRFNGTGGAGSGRTEFVRGPDLAARSLLGAAIEYGTGGKYFGVTVIGLSFLTNTDPWTMSIGYTKGGMPELHGGVEAPAMQDRVSVKLVTLRALQPQVRLVAWRFTLGLQVGLEFRSGQLTGLDPGGTDTSYPDGFIIFDLMASARANVRFTIVEGLYLMAQANYTQYLIGEPTNADVHSSSSWGFNLGVGYGF